jgi:hypothetical protein
MSTKQKRFTEQSIERLNYDRRKAPPSGNMEIRDDVVRGFPWDGAARYMIRDRDRIYGPLPHADFAPWASEISQLRQPRPGRMALPSG